MSVNNYSNILEIGTDMILNLFFLCEREKQTHVFFF